MGTWGFRNFQNDDAGDWVVKLTFNPNWTFIEDTILQRHEDQIFRSEAEILAAIEVIAIKKGKPPLDYHEVDFNLEEVVQKLPALQNEDLTQLSIQAAKEILANSEMRELIDDPVGYEEWSEIVLDLISRVK